MRRWGLIAVLIGVGVVVSAGLFLIHQRGREPQYQGRRLSEWLGGEMSPAVEIIPQEHGAIQAVHHIGTNALPWLVKWTLYEEPAWRRRLPDGVRRVLGLQDGSDVRVLGLRGLWSLGPLAGPAAPALESVVRNPRSSDILRYGAVGILRDCGTNAVAVLVNIISDFHAADPVLAEAAMGVLEVMPDLGTNEARCADVLSFVLEHDQQLCTSAATTIGWFGSHGMAKQYPDRFVAGLTPALSHGDAAHRLWAAEALAEFKSQARPAAPKLLELALHDPDLRLRPSARAALGRIAPEMLATVDGHGVKGEEAREQ